MGRRALPKIDEQLDLRPFLKMLSELTPWNPAAWFGRSVPLEIEVGSGKGMFITSAAARCPEHNFLGIEIAHKYARFCAARIAKLSLTNALMLEANAQLFWLQVVPDAAVTAVHIYFPDPWWKKRHWKRRIMNDVFLMSVYRSLVPGGQLHFWTDVEAYFVQTLDLIRQRTNFQGPLAVMAAPEDENGGRTHFDRRMKVHNQPVYRCRFCK
jgi:tRNA (guanine-N7-)-methyltransferase